jgi:hypothetical protein
MCVTVPELVWLAGDTAPTESNRSRLLGKKERATMAPVPDANVYRAADRFIERHGEEALPVRPWRPVTIG